MVVSDSQSGAASVAPAAAGTAAAATAAGGEEGAGRGGDALPASELEDVARTRERESVELTQWVAAARPDRPDLSIVLDLMDEVEALGGLPTAEDYSAALSEARDTKDAAGAMQLLRRSLAAAPAGRLPGAVGPPALGKLAVEACLAARAHTSAMECLLLARVLSQRKRTGGEGQKKGLPLFRATHPSLKTPSFLRPQLEAANVEPTAETLALLDASTAALNKAGRLAQADGPLAQRGH